MSAKATGIVLEADLPRPEKFVLLSLAEHAHEDGTEVRVSLWRVVWATGYSETQAREHLRSLVKKKILVLTHQGGKFDGDVNRYLIDYKAIPRLKAFKEWSAERRQAEKTKQNEGTETNPSGVRKPTPHEGTVPADERVRFSGNEGTVATAPKPRSIRTKSNLEVGNSASELPPKFALEAEGLEAKEKTKPQDPRFPEICDAIRKCWPKGEAYKCDITPADAGAINRMLAAKHDWKAEELSLCIAARFLSASVNPTESVKRWISAVTEYQSGPQDKYGNPLYAGGELNQWRNQARTMLYGPQPEQLEFKPVVARIQLPEGFRADEGFDSGIGIKHGAWLLIKHKLEKTLRRHVFDTWIKPCRSFGIAGTVLWVIAPSADFKDLSERFENELRDVLPPGIESVKFVTHEEVT